MEVTVFALVWSHGCNLKNISTCKVWRQVNITIFVETVLKSLPSPANLWLPWDFCNQNQVFSACYKVGPHGSHSLRNDIESWIWFLESVIWNVFTTSRNVTSIAGIRIQPCSKQETLDFTHRSYIIVSHYNILCNIMTSVPPQKSGPSTSRTLRGPDPTLEHFGLANISPLLEHYIKIFDVIEVFLKHVFRIVWGHARM